MELIPITETGQAPAERFTGDVFVTPIKQARIGSEQVTYAECICRMCWWRGL
jgi:hypothetical protein